ncbi:alpha-amylase family glycosyl hydrolase [Novosphingobium panipatense]
MSHGSADFSFSRPDRMINELGAEYTGEGTHFGVFSENAEAIELCLFSEDGEEETARLELPSREGSIFSGYLPGVGRASFTVSGRTGPMIRRTDTASEQAAARPYAREVSGSLHWDDALWGYDLLTGDDTTFDTRDSAAFMVKGSSRTRTSTGRVTRRWPARGQRRSSTRLMCAPHDAAPGRSRSSARNVRRMASEPILDHLKKLGVSAIELLPSQFFLDDRMLLDKGLSNYWGYQTLGFFAPEPRFLRNGDLAPRAIRQFKDMVKRFHKAGIEVIMDVVYNHTAEGSEKGPTLSFRGLDNASYYMLSPENPRFSFDNTGTGNTLSVAHPMVMRMVLDSLRYWVQVMHVDGFRFDLASTLGREGHGFDREAASSMPFAKTLSFPA